jgi:hypothetical protein
VVRESKALNCISILESRERTIERDATSALDSVPGSDDSSGTFTSNVTLDGA